MDPGKFQKSRLKACGVTDICKLRDLNPNPNPNHPRHAGFSQICTYYKSALNACNFCPFFNSLPTTMVTLMWASLDMVGLDSLKVFEDQSLIQFWSASLFTLYHAASMIVLLNMLIAMMSNSYQQVEVGADKY